MVKKILKKGFIGERGFKQFIPPFKEVIKNRGWKIICEHMPPGLAALVREFYTNMVGRKETTCYVRGKWVSFHRHEINQLLKLGKLSDVQIQGAEKEPRLPEDIGSIDRWKRGMKGKQEDSL